MPSPSRTRPVKAVRQDFLYPGNPPGGSFETDEVHWSPAQSFLTLNLLTQFGRRIERFSLRGTTVQVSGICKPTTPLSYALDSPVKEHAVSGNLCEIWTTHKEAAILITGLQLYERRFYESEFIFVLFLNTCANMSLVLQCTSHLQEMSRCQTLNEDSLPWYCMKQMNARTRRKLLLTMVSVARTTGPSGTRTVLKR